MDKRNVKELFSYRTDSFVYYQLKPMIITLCAFDDAVFNRCVIRCLLNAERRDRNHTLNLGLEKRGVVSYNLKSQSVCRVGVGVCVWRERGRGWGGGWGVALLHNKA